MSLIDSSLALSSSDNSGLREMVHTKSLSEEAKIAEATRQFEVIMLNMFLRDALKAPTGGYLQSSGANQTVYGSLVNEVLADSLSRTGDFGFATSLQSQIQN